MRTRRVIPLLLVAAMALVGLAAPSAVAGARDRAVVERFAVQVGAEVAHGYLAYPVDRTPTVLLVYGHGCCGPRSMAKIDERLAFARTHAAVVVAMDYRGRGGWDVAAGAADVVAATEALQRRFPIERTVIWGLSMGAEVTGMAVAARPDLYDWWVGTAGVYDLVSQWATPGFRTLIEAETRGTPTSRPAAYRQRSPVHLAADMKGIEGAVLVHGAGDPIALQDQAWRMDRALTEAGIRSRLEVVALGDQVHTPYLPVVGMGRYKSPLALAGHDGAVAIRSAAIVGELLRPKSARS